MFVWQKTQTNKSTDLSSQLCPALARGLGAGQQGQGQVCLGSRGCSQVARSYHRVLLRMLLGRALVHDLINVVRGIFTVCLLEQVGFAVPVLLILTQGHLYLMVFGWIMHIATKRNLMMGFVFFFIDFSLWIKHQFTLSATGDKENILVPAFITAALPSKVNK